MNVRPNNWTRIRSSPPPRISSLVIASRAQAQTGSQGSSNSPSAYNSNSPNSPSAYNSNKQQPQQPQRAQQQQPQQPQRLQQQLPQQPQTQGRRDIPNYRSYRNFCWTHNTFDHSALDCEELRGLCFQCGEAGHMRRFCPRATMPSAFAATGPALPPPGLIQQRRPLARQPMLAQPSQAAAAPMQAAAGWTAAAQHHRNSRRYPLGSPSTPPQRDTTQPASLPQGPLGSSDHVLLSQSDLRRVERIARLIRG